MRRYTIGAQAVTGVVQLKLLFMGTPDFAVSVLAALLDAGHDVVSVWTRPDRPAGRGQRSGAPPVEQFAEKRGLPVFQPGSLKSPEVMLEMESDAPDAIVVAAYGRFIPHEVFERPPLGCLNVHPSLLPRYRGPSPVTTALRNGDQTTGVTVMQVIEEMDAGPVLAARETAVGEDETAEELTRRLFELGADLLVETLPLWQSGSIQAEPQDESLATVTRLLTREDGEIDWKLGADEITRQVRAYQPWPGSYTHWQSKLLKIVSARPGKDAPEGTAPGTVWLMADGKLSISTGEGALVVRELQLEGRRTVSAEAFLAGLPEIVGAVLGQ